nr:gp58-like family protein [Geobacillus sp. DSP4a]
MDKVFISLTADVCYDKRRKEVNRVEGATIVQQILKALDLHSGKIQQQMKEMEDRLRTEIQDTESRLRVEIQDTESRLRAEIQDTENRLRAEIQDTENRLRAEIQDTENRLYAKIRETEDRLHQKLLDLEKRTDARFERLETKMNYWRLEWSETQETVDFLARKTLQHERKLRSRAGQNEIS